MVKTVTISSQKIKLRPLTAAALITTAAILIATGSASAATTYQGPAKSKVAVIVVHGGGYLLGDNQMTDDSAKAFAAQGLRAINLEYPLGDLDGASRAVERAAQEAKANHRYVYVYGESAGGGLASLAAARRWVDGGFAWAPTTNLTSWKVYTEQINFIDWKYFTDSSPGALTRNSAITYASKKSAPLLVVHGRDDTLVPHKQSTELKKRWPKMKLLTVSGGHGQQEKSYLNATKTALKCFTKKKHCSWAKAN